MSTNLAQDIAHLPTLTVGQLRSRYAEVFGEMTNAYHRTWLIKRIAWRLQAVAEGGLSERARLRAAELANDADLRLSPPNLNTIPTPEAAAPAASEPATFGQAAVEPDRRLPPPGATLSRLYKGQLLQVKVLPSGFAYGGKVFASLSAVAKTITGSHTNGFLFFRLTKRGTSHDM
jgi:hypothetical protein